MRITRFLHNERVTTAEMFATARARTAERVAGRHVLVIQDTTTVRMDEAGDGVAAHVLIAVDAVERALLGPVDAQFLARAGGKKRQRRAKALEEKESRRWLDGEKTAAELLRAGASCVTVLADREGDIYEDFALRPEGVELVIRAGQDRALVGGGRLFQATEGLPEAGRMTVALPAAPGRAARDAVMALRFREVEIARPRNRLKAERERLPPAISLTLVEAREVDPPEGAPAARWLLLSTHTVADAADARRIVSFYKERWTIEELFRTCKTKGFDIEALRQAEDGPLEKLAAACLIAAVTVLQLVRERDGTARRPLEDAFDPDDRPAIEAVSASLEGKTAKQKNPHPKGSLAFASWVCARLGGWTGYYGKPGPITILRGLVQLHAIKHGWSLRDV